MQHAGACSLKSRIRGRGSPSVHWNFEKNGQDTTELKDIANSLGEASQYPTIYPSHNIQQNSNASKRDKRDIHLDFNPTIQNHTINLFQ